MSSGAVTENDYPTFASSIAVRVCVTQVSIDLSSLSFSGISNSSLPLTKETELLFAGKKGTPPYFSFSAAVHKNNIDNTGTYRELLQYVEVSDTESFMVNDITIGEKKGKRIAYSYIEKPPGIKSEFPIIIKVYTDIITFDRYTFIFTYKAGSQHFNAGLTRYAKILESIRWKGL